MNNSIKFDETNLYEKNIAAKIGQLESDAQIKRAELQEGKVTAEKFQTLNEMTKEISDLKIKLLYEQELKRRVWRKYADKMTADDFSRLWNQSLRDSSIVSEVEKDGKAMQEASKHTIYSKW